MSSYSRSTFAKERGHTPCGKRLVSVVMASLKIMRALMVNLFAGISCLNVLNRWHALPAIYNPGVFMLLEKKEFRRELEATLHRHLTLSHPIFPRLMQAGPANRTL